MIDFRRIPEGPLAVFGPTWNDLSEFDRIVLESLTESDSDFAALLTAMEQNAETHQQRALCECMRCFVERLATK